ncbi:MAG: hypothetical protein JNK04_03285 [Myxococcales bacterium]|nr:hypothetical protein [Myxococcales bacterium]
MRMAVLALAGITLLSPASARADSDCSGGTQLASIQPSDGQTGVPIDVVPRVFVGEDEDGCSDIWADVSLRLLREGEALEETQRTINGTTETTELVLPGPLEPNTTYTFVVDGNDYDGPASRTVTFTTGATSAAPVEAPPQIEITDAVYADTAAGTEPRHQASIHVTLGSPDPTGLSTIRVLDPNGFALGAYVIGSDPVESEVHFYAPHGTEICLTPVQINAAGDAVSGEEVCVTPTVAESSGCSAAPGRVGNGVLPVALALAMCLFRRRRAGV